MLQIRIPAFILIRIRIRLYTLIRIRIRLVTLMRIRIRLVILMQIRILLRIKVMRICDHCFTDPSGLHFKHPRLHCEHHTVLHDSIFTLMRIRIQLPKTMRIHPDQDPQQCKHLKIHVSPMFIFTHKAQETKTTCKKGSDYNMFINYTVLCFLIHYPNYL